jgi:hypothetical protein
MFKAHSFLASSTSVISQSRVLNLMLKWRAPEVRGTHDIYDACSLLVRPEYVSSYGNYAALAILSNVSNLFGLIGQTHAVVAALAAERLSRTNPCNFKLVLTSADPVLQLGTTF